MKNWIIGTGILVIIIVAAVFMFSGGKTDTGSAVVTGNVVNDQPTAQVQKVIISAKDLNYYPQEIRVKAGQPVSISLDSNVKGCLRSFAIRDLGISKYLKTSQDTLDFTPTQKGKYTFACSMGMGYGKLVVE